MTNRLPDWDARLRKYLASVAHRPFDGDTYHCGHFTAGAVEAETGRDLFAEWSGQQGIANGLRALKQSGHADHIGLLATLFDEVPVAFARPGDVAVLNASERVPDLGIVQGEAVYVLRADGLGSVPLLTAERVFRL